MRKLTIVLAPLLVVCVSCVTVKAPDGSETTRVDTEALAQGIVLAEQGLALAQQAYEMYQQLHPAEAEPTDAEELERLQTRIDYWTAVLQRLYATYAALNAQPAETPTASDTP